MWWLSDGLMLFFNILAFASALVFLFIVARHRTCQHLSAILVANTCCAGLIAASAGISQAISMLFGLCDYSEQCVVAAYFYMSGCGAIFHSLCLQALHRLFSNVLTTGIGNHGILRSRRFYTILIIVQWLISITYVLPVYRNIVFIPGSCLCQMSLTHIPSFFDGLFGIYVIPLSLIIIVYLIIWRCHMKRMKARARQSIAQRHRMHREVVMFKRIIIPLVILFIAGCPYLIFFFLAQFIGPPIGYAQRVAALVVAVGWAIIMIFNILVTHSVKKQLINMMRCRPQRQVQCITIQTPQRRAT